MKSGFLALVLSVGLVATAASSEETAKFSQFEGKLDLEENGCPAMKDGKPTAGPYRLRYYFGYVDRWGVPWQADAGDCTDGASIPAWAQPIIGPPMTPQYLPAAVLHDHYSKSVRPVRSWLKTQRMFHEVLLASHVAPDRAALLYAGVLIGSGKWIDRMEPKPCETGAGSSTACINSVGNTSLVLRTSPESYDSPEFAAQLAEVQAQLKEQPSLSDYAIEALVRDIAGTNVYLDTPDGVIPPEGAILQ